MTAPEPALRAAVAASPTSNNSGFARGRAVLAGVGAALLGAAPHVLHHAGPLAGAALVAGVTGKVLFGLIGIALTVPMLRRMRRRTGSWRAPVAALGLMAIVFVVSSFVLGPALTGGSEPAGNTPSTPAVPSGHGSHHG